MARNRPRILVILAALLVNLSPWAMAQTEPGALCRVHWQEQTYGGDRLTTTAVFDIPGAMPQMDGSVLHMGHGDAHIVFTPGGHGCTATRGRNATVRMMIIVSSDDGETAEIDIGPAGQDAFPVAVSCPAGHNSTMDVTVSAPPTAELPLHDGASAAYDVASRHSFGTVGGQRGSVRLEYCQRAPN